MQDSQWKLIGSYTVSMYRCGLRVGQRIALRRELIITDADGPTGKVYPVGEQYTVLHGSKDDPGIVWLLQEDGQRCTWDDEPEIHEWFEVVDQPRGDSTHPPAADPSATGEV
jgi:hypothetical protein